MARPKQFETNADRQKAYRERKAQDVDPELPVREIDEREPAPGERRIEKLLALSDDAPLSEREEQLLRDHFGYASSERRTRAERAQTAQRIRDANPVPEIDLPGDIAAVWTGKDASTAKVLIDAWGIVAFRTSAIHTMALGEIERARKQTAYLARSS